MSENSAVVPVEDAPEQWPVVSSRDIYRGDWVVALRADEIRSPGRLEDEPFERLVVAHAGAAVVLAVDSEQRVVCVRQYRHAAQFRLVELPAGVLDEKGEEPLDVARRELVEEVGLDAASWTHLASVYSSPGYSSEVQHLFLARDLTPADRGDFVVEHEEADMQTVWVPFAELHAAVLDGRLRDGPLVSAVLLARARGLVGGTPG